jgi:hypothetical protein
VDNDILSKKGDLIMDGQTIISIATLVLVIYSTYLILKDKNNHQIH